MPAAQPADLGLWLGRDVDLERAEFLLGKARDLVVIASGLPADAWPAGLETVQLSATVRAYTNPAGKGQDAVGSRQYTVRDVGIYLTATEEAEVRRAVGRANLTSVPLVTPAERSRVDTLPGWTPLLP